MFETLREITWDMVSLDNQKKVLPAHKAMYIEDYFIRMKQIMPAYFRRSVRAPHYQGR